MYFEE